MMDRLRPYLHPPVNGRALVEIPVSWVLDDAPYFMFTGQRAIQPPGPVLQGWLTEFEGITDGRGDQLHLPPADHRPAVAPGLSSRADRPRAAHATGLDRLARRDQRALPRRRWRATRGPASSPRKRAPRPRKRSRAAVPIGGEQEDRDEQHADAGVPELSSLSLTWSAARQHGVARLLRVRAHPLHVGLLDLLDPPRDRPRTRHHHRRAQDRLGVAPLGRAVLARSPRRSEELSLTLGEGPCVDALAGGLVLVPDLGTSPSWRGGRFSRRPPWQAGARRSSRCRCRSARSGSVFWTCTGPNRATWIMSSCSTR